MYLFPCVVAISHPSQSKQDLSQKDRTTEDTGLSDLNRLCPTRSLDATDWNQLTEASTIVEEWKERATSRPRSVFFEDSGQTTLQDKNIASALVSPRTTASSSAARTWQWQGVKLHLNSSSVSSTKDTLQIVIVLLPLHLFHISLSTPCCCRCPPL